MKHDTELIDHDATVLKKELEQFKQEKEKIRALVGQIGGTSTGTRDKIINHVFIFAIAALFVLDVLHEGFGYQIPLPSFLSLQLGVFLVSIKIIWMMHRQTKVEHFQFWILNSLEFRLNDLNKQMRELHRKLDKN